MADNPFIEKATSGRFWLTIITGIVFTYAVWKRVLNAEATATIITMVFISYFQKGVDVKQPDSTVTTTTQKTGDTTP